MPRPFFVTAVVIGGLLAGSGLALAKAGARAEGKHGSKKDHLENIAEALQLTPEQREKLKPILQEQAQKLKAVRHDNLGREQKRAKLADLRKDLVARIKPILTAEQMDKLKARHEKLIGKRHREK